MPTLFWTSLSVLAVGLLYALAELAKSLPGDTFLPEESSTCTRAITIDAPPDRVWPWIAQMGQGRGGFYRYAWLENLFGCQIVRSGVQQISVGAHTLHHGAQDDAGHTAARRGPNWSKLNICVKLVKPALRADAIVVRYAAAKSTCRLEKRFPHALARTTVQSGSCAKN